MEAAGLLDDRARVREPQAQAVLERTHRQRRSEAGEDRDVPEGVAGAEVVDDAAAVDDLHRPLRSTHMWSSGGWSATTIIEPAATYSTSSASTSRRRSSEPRESYGGWLPLGKSAYSFTAHPPPTDASRRQVGVTRTPFRSGRGTSVPTPGVANAAILGTVPTPV